MNQRLVALEGFDEQVVGAGQARAQLLPFQPFADIGRHFGPALGGVEQAADARGEIGGERQAAALVGGDGGAALAEADVDVGLFEADDFKGEAGEDEAVADAKLRAEPFLDAAERRGRAARR